jgi:hypothetical protein
LRTTKCRMQDCTFFGSRPTIAYLRQLKRSRSGSHTLLGVGENQSRLVRRSLEAAFSTRAMQGRRRGPDESPVSAAADWVSVFKGLSVPDADGMIDQCWQSLSRVRRQKLSVSIVPPDASFLHHFPALRTGLLRRFRSIRRSEETHRVMHREFAVLQLCAIQKLKMAARISCCNNGSTGLLDIV